MANLTEAYRLPAQGSGSTTATLTANGQCDPFPAGAIDTMEIDINVSTLTATSINFTYYRLDPWNNPYPVASKTLTTAGTITFDIGPGLTNGLNPGAQGYIAWTIVGTSAVVSIWVGGK